MVIFLNGLILLGAVIASYLDWRCRTVRGPWLKLLYISQFCLRTLTSEQALTVLQELLRNIFFYWLILGLLVLAETRLKRFLLGGADLKAIAFIHYRYKLLKCCQIVTLACVIAACYILCRQVLVRSAETDRSLGSSNVCPLFPFLLCAALILA